MTRSASSPSDRRIRAVSFDLGGTLVDFRDFPLFGEVAAELGIPVEIDHLTHAMEATERWSDGSPERDGPLGAFWAHFLSEASGSIVPVETGIAFRNRLRELEHHPRLFSDVRTCLDELRAQKRTLGVVSNSRSEEVVRSHLSALGIDRYFRAVISSGTEGVSKPDPRIFLLAVERLGRPAQEILHVGDFRETDARGASRAGLHGVWLHRGAVELSDDPLEVTSLSELPGLIRRIESAR